MDFYLVLLLSVFTPSKLLASKYDDIFRGNFWQNFAPGGLLNELDLMTTNGLQNRRTFVPLTSYGTEATTTTPFTTTLSSRKRLSTKQPNQKSKPIKRRISTNQDNSAAATSTSTSNEQDDYERTYEEFVSRYFNDAANRYLADENDEHPNSASSSVESSNLSSSIEDEIISSLDAQPFEASSKFSEKAMKKCRKINKNGEVCLICRNPRNGERSETCSYEHSTDPESYAYETQRKYSKSRDVDNDENENYSSDVKDDENENYSSDAKDDKNENYSSDAKDDEDSSSDVAESEALYLTVTPPIAAGNNNSNGTSANSSCLKRITDEKACYYCRSGLNEPKINCFNLIAKPFDEKSVQTKPLKLKNKTHEKRRIFKRTISYVYEKGHDSNETINLPQSVHQNSTEIFV